MSKKPNLDDSMIGRQFAEKMDAFNAGTLDTSKIDGLIGDPRPPAGVMLGPVAQYPVDRLQDHPLNSQFFQELPPAEYEALKKDIDERGVMVPIIATPAGVILSGHRRARISRELGRLNVPVQFVKGELNASQEREFLIKDNLLRRHLGPDEKRALIIALYGDEIDQDRRGGDRRSKSVKSKVQSEPLIRDNTPEPLPVRIERETGGAVTAGTSKRIIADIRKERTGKAIKTPPPPPDRLKIIKSYLAKIVRTLDGANKKTTDAAIIKIIETLDQIGIDPRYSNQVKKIKENMRA